ncbi:GNAT family N-acetyltransferase [Streptomyces sp. NPDC048560]|uniref:GNAT family N-acetyltransferase n=1 Tax=Streptomyces sp. NPDC048560 TaxID=3155488 RepID=UPI00343DF470
MTSTNLDDRSERVLLEQIERYYDAVPRHSARVEELGALTLFVREGRGWPFYARPARGWTGEVSAAAVARVRARQRELAVPESFEWIDEVTPTLRAAVEGAGLVVHEHPLMVLDPDARVTGAEAVSGDSAVRILGPDDPALASALAVPHLAFAEPGTGVGAAGVAELAEIVRSQEGDGSVEPLVARIRAGLTSVAAVVKDGAALCAGQHQPVGTVSEIVGVGTLPAARRRGFGLSVTVALVADARSRGVETIFLSAGDDDVARLYARLGFRRVATALIAEPSE